MGVGNCLGFSFGDGHPCRLLLRQVQALREGVQDGFGVLLVGGGGNGCLAPFVEALDEDLGLRLGLEVGLAVVWWWRKGGVFLV